MRRGKGSDRLLRAYHEAGHVVAAWRLKLPVTGASMVRQYSAAAQSAITRLEASGGDDLLERRAIVLMAGVEAESYLTQDEDWWAATEDRRAIDRVITQMVETGVSLTPRDMAEEDVLTSEGEDRRSQLWRVLAWRTHQLMAQPPVRSAVFALAGALMRQGSLQSAEVTRYIRRGVASADPDLLLG